MDVELCLMDENVSQVQRFEQARQYCERFTTFFRRVADMEAVCREARDAASFLASSGAAIEQRQEDLDGLTHRRETLTHEVNALEARHGNDVAQIVADGTRATTERLAELEVTISTVEQAHSLKMLAGRSDLDALHVDVERLQTELTELRNMRDRLRLQVARMRDSANAALEGEDG